MVSQFWFQLEKRRRWKLVRETAWKTPRSVEKDGQEVLQVPELRILCRPWWSRLPCSPWSSMGYAEIHVQPMWEVPTSGQMDVWRRLWSSGRAGGQKGSLLSSWSSLSLEDCFPVEEWSQFWKDCLPVGGIYIAAVLWGQLLTAACEIATMLEKLMENCFLWKGTPWCHRGTTTLLEPSGRKGWWTDQNPHPPVSLGFQRVGGSGWGKKPLKPPILFLSILLWFS